MIRHIVMWKLKEEKKAENAEHIKNSLESLAGKIDGLISAKVFCDITNGADGSFDLCLDSLFTDLNALNNYKIHPLHVAVSDFVKSVRKERSCVDFEVFQVKSE